MVGREHGSAPHACVPDLCAADGLLEIGRVYAPTGKSTATVVHEMNVQMQILMPSSMLQWALKVAAEKKRRRRSTCSWRPVHH